jgi:hypothetical protein
MKLRRERNYIRAAHAYACTAPVAVGEVYFYPLIFFRQIFPFIL